MYDVFNVFYSGGIYTMAYVESGEWDTLTRRYLAKHMDQPDQVGILLQHADTGEVAGANWITETHRDQFHRRRR